MTFYFKLPLLVTIFLSLHAHVTSSSKGKDYDVKLCWNRHQFESFLNEYCAHFARKRSITREGRQWLALACIFTSFRNFKNEQGLGLSQKCCGKQSVTKTWSVTWKRISVLADSASLRNFDEKLPKHTSFQNLRKPHANVSIMKSMPHNHANPVWFLEAIYSASFQPVSSRYFIGRWT